MVQLTPIGSLRVSRHIIPSHNGFPNCSISHRPLLIYHRAFPSASASEIETHLTSVGVVKPQWRYTMYREHHFHSTTHEVLAVSGGAAKLCFGGLDNPERVVVEAGKGDVMVVPAGLAHALLEDRGGYQMVGSYPVEADQWDHCTGNEGQAAGERIRKLGWFARDPVYGDEGPVLE